MKRILTSLLVASFFIAMGGFVFKMLSSYSVVGKNIIIKEELTSIHAKMGLSIDSLGRIYIGSQENSSIHVFEKSGEFMYRICMNTGGAGDFKFYIDESDQLHVLIVRGEYELIIYEKELKEVNEVENLNLEIERYNLMIKNQGIVNVDNIEFENTSWPPSVTQIFLVMVLSMGGIFLLNRPYIVSILKKSQIR